MYTTYFTCVFAEWSDKCVQVGCWKYAFGAQNVISDINSLKEMVWREAGS